MKIIQMLTLLIICFAFTCVPAFSQTDEDASDVELTTNYNSEKGETQVEYTLKDLPGEGDKDFRAAVLTIHASYPGKTLTTTPKDIYVFISLVSYNKYRYPNIMSMKVVADGNPLDDFVMLNLDKRKLDKDFLETTVTIIKLPVLKKLAGASSVTMRLEDCTFQLGESHLKKLSEFMGAITPK